MESNNETIKGGQRVSDIKSRFIEEGITFTERKRSVKSLNVRDLPEKQKKLLDKLEGMTKND